MSEAVGEFDLIAHYFAPLAGPEGLGLLDDAALIQPLAGHDLVITADALVAGVHFRADDPLDLVARKALRVNLSDLAAKGARPSLYFLTIAWPRGTGPEAVAQFALGLSLDQDRYGIRLGGGDTVATPGPLCLSITALGHVPHGAMIRRSGAMPGDHVYVTGTIGDGAFGLDHPEIDALNQRYLLPEPRVDIGQALVGIAHAAMDVSDGLIADAGHLARASGVHLSLDIERVPLSEAARTLVTASPDLIWRALTGGDDYEILFTMSPDRAREIAALPGITRIGAVTAGQGVSLCRDGNPLDTQRLGLGSGGWQHRLAP